MQLGYSPSMASALFNIITICIVLIALLYGALPRRAAAGAGVLRRPPPQSGTAGETICVATYNIHGAKGTDGVRDLGRTEQAIRGVDIVALQEVRAGRRRNQAGQLAQSLQLGWLFVPTLRRWYRNYRGNALLSRFPVSRWRTHMLPNITGRRYRVFTVAEVDLGHAALTVLFTHLHTRQGREQQLEMVLEHFRGLAPPAVLLGDLNTGIGDPLLARYLSTGWVDALSGVLEPAESASRVDWILVRGAVVRGGGSTGVGASDHPCYWVEVKV
jgi:endonuclease/exonuclease/phosphatase family metal-dependent hydrolase